MSRRLIGSAAPKWVRLAILIAVGIVVVVGRDTLFQAPASEASGSGEGEREILELFESRRSGEMVTLVGIVDRVLGDDNEGSRHQRFIVRMTSGHTVLVAHNIDLAPRVPLSVGARIRARGEYEWNEQGGVLHWTHHDPAGDRVGGWIELDGSEFR